MLTNGTISRIDRKSGANALGEATFTAGSALTLRCSIQDPTGTQKLQLGATIKDATAVVYVSRAALVAAISSSMLWAGDRLVLAQDGCETAWTGEVLRTTTQQQKNVSHLEVFVRKI